MSIRMLLFDLDGTLLRSDKTLSPRTLAALKYCRKQGILIGIATSRGELNAMEFLKNIQPDAVISSAGALLRCHEEIVHQNGFSADETAQVLRTIQTIGGPEVAMTVDTINDYYRNYLVPKEDTDQTWAMGHMTDYAGFCLPSLKICFETVDSTIADAIAAALPFCDLIHFSDGPWYKLTPKTATKETAILQMCKHLGIKPDEIVAFGDDTADIGMLRLCGMGVAMGNAIDAVKAIADAVIGCNDGDGIADWLYENF